MTGPSAIREQKERREIIRTGNQPASSFFQEAVKGRSLEGGDYVAQRDLTITGEGVYQVPRLPASSPWSGDPVGLEPPTGIDINALEPCGTFAEVLRSELAADQAATELLFLPDDDESDSPVIGRHPLTAGATPAVGAEPPADPAYPGSVPPASSPDVVDRGGSVHPQVKRRRKL